MNKNTRAADFSRQFSHPPKWVWAVRFLLMFLGVLLVNHVFWPMKFESSFGWVGYLRASLAGMFGALLWVGFDVFRQKMTKNPPVLPEE